MMSRESLLEYIARVSPWMHLPEHLCHVAERFEHCMGAGLRSVVSLPPQHGATLFVIHALSYLGEHNPEKRNAYLTYSAKRADAVAKAFGRVGGKSCMFSSILGGIPSGHAVDGVLVIDCPYKNRSDVESERLRGELRVAFENAIETRLHPGASVIVLSPRWDANDFSGWLIGKGWDEVRLPAIAEANDPNGRAVGEALFPKLWPIDALESKRSVVRESTWAALYQGRPVQVSVFT
jgi:hypothetical protein